jgi:hypothetical protein
MQRVIYLCLLLFYSITPLSAKTTKYNFYPIVSLHNNGISIDSNSSVENPFQISLLEYGSKLPSGINPRYEKLITELAYVQVFAIGTIGVIALLPEGVSNWSEEDKTLVDAQELFTKHADNIAKGPVWDNDAWAVNYIGHSVAGSYFYVWGRQSGLSWQESAVLTTLMSTFFWEYGWEAFAEVPSTQDLIVTPLLGSLLGEGTNYLYNKVIENDGKIYNSYILGGLGRAFLNPIGEMNMYLANAFEAADIEISVDYAYTQNIDNYRLRSTIENNGQRQSYFKLNFKFKY